MRATIGCVRLTARRPRRVPAGVVAALLFAPLAGFPAPHAAPLPGLCVDCIEIRVGPPIVLRGPSPHEPDAPFSLITLANGGVRGFAANGATFAIDGGNPADMGGPKRAVLGPGPKGGASECGSWLTSLWRADGKLYGLVHNEAACDGENETHKSMSVATSTDEGLTWNSLGTVIAFNDAPAPGRQSGEGDCTAIDGEDGFVYAYCQRLRDWKNTVARAPRADPSPGRWLKWDGGAWRAPALGGTGAPLEPFVGLSAAYWADQRVVVLLGMLDRLQISFSADKVRFKPLAEPLLYFEGGEWKRPAPSDLYAYPALMREDGSPRVSRDALLTYTYVPPGEDFTQRYLVMHDLRIRLRSAPVAPQVGVALTRWTGEGGRLWTTAGPPIEHRSARGYRFEKQLGYLMTAAPAQASVKLVECVRERDGRTDHLLAEEGGCAATGHTLRRPAGFVYRDARPGTVPLHQCFAASGDRHFASNRADCEGAGKLQKLLGYLLAG